MDSSRGRGVRESLVEDGEMKNPFDRVVGPMGERRLNYEGGSGGEELSEREEFILRCLNAAVNLYGIVTAKEVCGLYNGYAKNHDSPVSEPLSEDELLAVTQRHLSRIAEKEERDILDALLEDAWFTPLYDEAAREWLFVYQSLAEEMDRHFADEVTMMAVMRTIVRKLGKRRAQFCDVPLKTLPEKAFLLYDDPMGDEETTSSRNLVKFLKKACGVSKDNADSAVMNIQANLRVNGASLTEALEQFADWCDYEPADEEEYYELIGKISPVVSTTRTWEYRGHTQSELVKMGVIERVGEEEIPDFKSLFGGECDYDSDDECYDDDYDDEGEDDDYLVDDDGEEVRVEDLPPAKLTGSFDFKSVKDAKVRDRLLWEYEGVRLATRDFVRREVMREMTKEERRDAAKRLGVPIDPNTGFVADGTLDCVVGDFASMMDDQHGEPAIKRVLKRKDKLKGDLDRAAAEYYENYRYTWLEVLAVKAGVGVKCRDLMAGEDIFLMEKSLSQSDVKCMTICAGIAPMGEVYLSLGVIHPAHFESPATILKIVLAHLGLPTELPVRLSFADQARFAAETIRRINANGKFGGIFYGGSV